MTISAIQTMKNFLGDDLFPQRRYSAYNTSRAIHIHHTGSVGLRLARFTHLSCRIFSHYRWPVQGKQYQKTRLFGSEIVGLWQLYFDFGNCVKQDHVLLLCGEMLGRLRNWN